MRYLPVEYKNVYVTSCSHFLPGEPVNNQQMDDYIAPLNAMSDRIKRRILKENGITQRYYAINEDGSTRYSATDMAAQATTACIRQSHLKLSDITLLTTGCSGEDVLMPGLANMLQGKLNAPAMETISHHGICAAGVHALKNAANSVQSGQHNNAIVTAVDFPSRLFKRSRYEPQNYNVDFDSHFLRWMLSDGAGSCLLTSQIQASEAMVLKLDWMHSKSFSGDYPVCMQFGLKTDTQESYLDYPSFSQAETSGIMNLRQNIRLLPQLFEVGIHEYIELVKHQYIKPDNIDHFLCHYSSEALGKETEALMKKAGLEIPREKWFSNLTTCGNTGAASIFIMLSEFMRNPHLKHQQRVLCFVPESGRFTVSFFMFTVIDTRLESIEKNDINEQNILSPHSPHSVNDYEVKNTLQSLAGIWHQYRSRIWRSPLVNRVLNGKLTLEDYRNWMSCWIPQVREGSIWMRTAISNLPPEFEDLKSLIETHAREEQDDYQILFQDYLAAGGIEKNIDNLQRNPGGEALNAYMYSVANSGNPIGLLGGIYIIEGTGQRIIPALLPDLRKQLPLKEQSFRFLRYHGENDIRHLSRWLKALTLALQAQPESKEFILKTAENIAQLYFIQWEHVI